MKRIFSISVIMIISIISIFQNTALADEPEKKLDRYGQMNSVDYPEKVTSDEQLKANIAKDKEYYESLTQPSSKDEYGGLKGSKEQFSLKATGYFHVEQLENGNWTIVNPIGNMFFSLGVNSTGAVGDTYTKVSGRESIYEWLPPFSANDPFYTAYMNGNNENYSYYVSNLIKKFGKPFDQDEYTKQSVDRVKRWGFNSGGGWTHAAAYLKNDFPMFVFLPMPKNTQCTTVKVYDVFMDGWEQAVDKAIRQFLLDRVDNTALMGYYIDNELQYERMGATIPASKASEVATKGKLVDILKEKYEDDISEFNTAWSAKYISFDDVYDDTSLSLRTDEAIKDFDEFLELYFDTFYSTVARIVKKYDPNHMLVGDRLASNTPHLNLVNVKSAGKYMDLITYNYYTYSVNTKTLDELYEAAQKPFILTEFHYGEPTRGLVSGVRLLKDPKEKGLGYRNYVEQVAKTGYVVGAHWFQYVDQSATGRYYQGYNGEAYAIGLIDVADQPYMDVVTSMKATNDIIYDIILGKKKPYEFDGFPAEKGEKTVLQIPKTKKAMIIDGELDSNWPKGSKITLSDTNRVLGVMEPNVEADFYFAWDQKKLYVFADIKDTSPMNNVRTGKNVWNGDGIEIFVGPEAEKLGQEGSLVPKDSQLLIAGGDKINGIFQFYWANNRTDEEQSEINNYVKMKADKTGYTIEAAIPLPALNIENIYPDMEIMFDFIFDNGENGSRKSQYVWNGNDKNSRDRSAWGRAQFVDSVTSTVSVKTKATATEKLSNAIALYLGSNKTLVNNETMDIDENSDVMPIIKNGRTLVPLRFIAEVLNSEVIWQQETSTVTINKDNKSIVFKINDVVYMDGQIKKELDAAPEIINDRTMLPLRAVAQAMGKKVFWDDKGLIIISDQQNIFDNTYDSKIIDYIITLLK